MAFVGLVALEGRAILVPALWSVEITNAVLMAERRKRVKQPEIRRFVELLDTDGYHGFAISHRKCEQYSSDRTGIRPFCLRRRLSGCRGPACGAPGHSRQRIAKSRSEGGDRDIQGQRCSRVGLFLTRTRIRFPKQHGTFSRHPPALTVSDCSFWPEVRQSRCRWPANRA